METIASFTEIVLFVSFWVVFFITIPPRHSFARLFYLSFFDKLYIEQP